MEDTTVVMAARPMVGVSRWSLTPGARRAVLYTLATFLVAFIGQILLEWDGTTSFDWPILHDALVAGILAALVLVYNWLKAQLAQPVAVVAEVDERE